MTVDQALACLREVRALERLQRAVQERPSPSFEWQCGAVALRDRIQFLTACLSLEDPAMIVQVQDHYDQALRLERLQPDTSSEYLDPQTPMPDLPKAARVH